MKASARVSCLVILLVGCLTGGAGFANAQAEPPSRAIATWEVFVKQHPADIEARVRLGNLYAQQRAYAKALSQFRSALSLNPDFAPALTGMARVLSWQGRFAESLRLYDRVLRSDPANGEAASGKAFVLLWSGRPQEAEVLFSTLCRRYPQDGELASGLRKAKSVLAEQARLARPAVRKIAHGEADHVEPAAQNSKDIASRKTLAVDAATPGRCAESIEYARQALTLQPRDDSLALSLAHSLSVCRQYSEAIERYRGYLELRPRDATALFELAQALLRSRRTAESAEVFRELLQLNPVNTDARLGLAQSLAAGSQFQEASSQYDEVLRASPHSYDALQGKAYMCYWTGQLVQAHMIFQSLAAWRPDDTQNAEALENIRRAEEEQRWTKLRPPPGAPAAEIARYWEKRVASYPDDVAAIKNLAYAQTQLKNLRAAISGYQELADRSPDDIDARMELARLLSVDGRHDASIAMYQQILARDPGNSSALESLASVYSSAGRTQEAVAIYRQLSATAPSNAGYQLELARLELNLKDHPAARETLTSVLADDPQNHEARVRLAQLELSEGAWDASLKHFRQLLNEAFGDEEALLGEAETSYYKGRLRQAESSAATLVDERPRDSDAVFLLANIEHARGDRRRTLDLLDRAGSLASSDPEIAKLKEKVREEPAATVHTSLKFAREIGPPGACKHVSGCGQLDLHEDLRAYSYGSTIELALLPRSTSFISFTALPSDSPLGRDVAGKPIPLGISGAVAPQEFLYRQSTELSSRLTVRGGAGLVKFGPGQAITIPGQADKIISAASSPVVQGGVSFAPSHALSFNLDLSRDPITYTPTAVHLGVMESRIQGGLSLLFSRTELHTNLFYADDSSKRYLHVVATNGQKVVENKTDDDLARGGSVAFDRNFVRSSHFSLDAGENSLIYGYAGRTRPLFLGFFTPGFYQSHLATARVYGQLHGPISYDFSGGAGIQQTEHGAALTHALTLSPTFTFKVSRTLSLSLGYTHYDTDQSLGSLRGNALRLSTDWKWFNF